MKLKHCITLALLSQQSVWQNYIFFIQYSVHIVSLIRTPLILTLAPLNEPISHKCQCIRSVVPQLETTLTSQPS